MDRGGRFLSDHGLDGGISRRRYQGRPTGPWVVSESPRGAGDDLNVRRPMGAPMKTQILAAMGENGLQQASALNAGLAANDRIKYAFSLLQMAIEHARHPEQPAASLKQERLAAAIDDPHLDAAVASAQVVDKKVRVPGPAGSWRGSRTTCA